MRAPRQSSPVTSMVEISMWMCEWVSENARVGSGLVRWFWRPEPRVTQSLRVMDALGTSG